MECSKYSLSSQKTSTKPPWRNGLARWTSNSKVVGSSPIGGVSLVLRQKIFASLKFPFSQLLRMYSVFLIKFTIRRWSILQAKEKGHVKVSLQQKLNYHSKPETQNSYVAYSEYSLSSQAQVSNLRGAMD